MATFNKIIEKGIAVHHSGINIFREIIEILFKEKYVKLLFATESMGIGVNMPVKATIHTSIKKFSMVNIDTSDRMNTIKWLKQVKRTR